MKYNAVIMGRKTWDSLPQKYRPLPGRINVILTRQPVASIGVTDENGMIEVQSDFEQALYSLSANPRVNEIYVIGGASVYEQAIKHFSEHCKLVILTRIGKAFEADSFMPRIPCDDEPAGGPFTKLHISKTYSHKDLTYDYCFIGNKKLLTAKPELIPTRLIEKYPRHPEMQYLEIIKEIIETGSIKDDRTGVGIIGKFGYQMRYDLEESFPILTTKDVFWRGVAEELIWFVKGDTNAKHLSDKKIRIWDGNASREFLDKIGLTEREEWDLGPVYGF